MEPEKDKPEEKGENAEDKPEAAEMTDLTPEKDPKGGWPGKVIIGGGGGGGG